MTTTFAANNRMSGLEYRFSPDRLAELNRAPVPLLLARLTTGCPSYGKTPADIDGADTLIAEIRDHCAGDTDFIRQSMPLQEIVFRTLLLDADSTMTLGQLHQELTERWSSAIRPITVTLSGLARILDNDEFYGFAAIPVDEPEPELADLPMLTAAGPDESDGLAQVLAAIAANVDDEEDDDDDLFEDDEDDEDDDTDLFIDDSPDDESGDAGSGDDE